MVVWLIGGTSDSVKIAQLLATHQINCAITVTTPTAVQLYPTSPYLKVKVGKLVSDLEAERFCQQELIQGIVDASHPYAIAISQRAIAVSKSLALPYLRYERPIVPISSTCVTICDSFAHLLQSNYLEGERVLITTGCNTLHHFSSWQERAILFTRILPREQSLNMAQEAGFSSERIIALRPPFSFELEMALWRHWRISMVVTKANGQAGGLDLKLQVAEAKGIPLIVISRPKLNYPQLTSNLYEVLTYICSLGD